ncbi:hypothetical protein Brms1b_008963 [Colletotrichum noveboracense]|nr:hypothetical protein COL940_003674 [Colletotrichum noveboracense]KAJ0289851.1 hypothetical protein CBS470a_004199 [Colletotrichum nupharicola]KAJ0309802.1 hypothetical protein Brms1b_008963 [Colletotrichum noveboracense]
MSTDSVSGRRSAGPQHPILTEELLSAFESLSTEVDNNTQWNATDVRKLTTEKFPDRNVRMEFFAYDGRRAQERVEKIINPQLTPRQCMMQIKNTDFTQSGPRAQWYWMMEMMFKKFHPIGFATHGGHTTGYGIDPGPVYLLPHGFNPNNHTGQRLHHSLLGINLDIGLEICDTDPGIPIKMINTGSDHVFTPPETGFVFAQIGSLRVFNGTNGWPKKGEPFNDAYMRESPWEETRFGVVVRIDNDGNPGAVYVIYNFWAHGKNIEANDHFRPPVRNHKNQVLPHVGQLHPKCNPGENFTVAKIANNIADLIPNSESESSLLVFSREFDFKVVSKEECHIGPAKQIDHNGKSYLLRDSIKGSQTRWG